MRSRRKAYGLTVLLLVMLGCMRKASLWIVEGSTRDNLVFGVAQDRGGSTPVHDMDDFTVRTCYTPSASQRIVWAISAVSDTVQPPLRITYGVVPVGYRADSASTPLAEGCYEADVSGTGVSESTRFSLDANGTIVEVSGSLVPRIGEHLG